MRSYVVTYDISDARRLRRVYQCLRSWGDHLQLSVFRCALSDRDRATLAAQLDGLIHHTEDQVLIIDLGKLEGRAREAIKAVGRPYTHPERHAVVI